jgi:hypothetical protein
MSKNIDQLNMLEECSHYLGDDSVLEEAKITIDGIEPLDEKEAEVVNARPKDIQDVDNKYIELYLRWLVTNFDKAAIDKRMDIHDGQSETLRRKKSEAQARNTKFDERPIDIQDLFSSMCEAAQLIIKGKPLEAGVKKVRSFISSRKSFK